MIRLPIRRFLLLGLAATLQGCLVVSAATTVVEVGVDVTTTAVGLTYDAGKAVVKAALPDDEDDDAAKIKP